MNVHTSTQTINTSDIELFVDVDGEMHVQVLYVLEIFTWIESVLNHDRQHCCNAQRMRHRMSSAVTDSTR